MSRISLITLFFVGLLLSVGCGDDDDAKCDGSSCVENNGNNANNANNDDNSHDHNNDDNSHDHNNDDNNSDDNNDIVQDLDFSPTEVQAALGTMDDGSRMWLVEATASDAVIGMEMYEAYGAATAPGVIDINGDETNYASCGTCLILRIGDLTFMPRAQGQVRFDAVGADVGGRLTGEILDVVFQEVTIAEDYQTTPVVDGELHHLESWPFDIELQALGGGTEICGGHGHLHGTECHCDTGYVVDPSDSSSCIPE